MNLNTLDLFIADKERSVNFYTDILGFEEIKVSTYQKKFLMDKYDKKHITGVWTLECHSFSINLYEMKAGKIEQNSVNTKGIRHFCLQTSQSKSILNRVLENWDLISLKPVPIVLGTGFKYAYGRDPEGNVIEVEEKIDDAGSLSHWIGHVSITTANIDDQITFYSKLLNTPPLAKSDIKNNDEMSRIGGFSDGDITMSWFKTAGIGLELIEYRRPETESYVNDENSTGYKSFGMTVYDLTSEYERLKSLEIQVSAINHNAFSLSDADGNNIYISEKQ